MNIKVKVKQAADIKKSGRKLLEKKKAVKGESKTYTAHIIISSISYVRDMTDWDTIIETRIIDNTSKEKFSATGELTRPSAEGVEKQRFLVGDKMAIIYKEGPDYNHIISY